MLGTIAGDIIGSRFEGESRVPYRFRLFDEGCAFTDDTVCTVAIAEALLTDKAYGPRLRRHVRRYPDRGYGAMFLEWALDDTTRAYGGWGNGAPIGWYFNTRRQVLGAAARQARTTHNTDEAVGAAQAVSLAILLLRKGRGPNEVVDEMVSTFGYRLAPPPYESAGFDVSAEGTAVQALSAALFSSSWTQAVRRVVRLGGDTDTLPP